MKIAFKDIIRTRITTVLLVYARLGSKIMQKVVNNIRKNSNAFVKKVVKRKVFIEALFSCYF